MTSYGYSPEALQCPPCLSLPCTMQDAAAFLACHSLDTVPVQDCTGERLGILHAHAVCGALLHSGGVAHTTPLPTALIVPDLPRQTAAPPPRHLTLDALYSEEGYRQLLDSIYNPIMLINPAGIICQCNQSFLRLFGLERHQVLGTPARSLIKDTALSRLFQTLQTETMRRVHIAGRAFLSNRTLLRTDCHIVGAVAVLHDVSELEAVSSELHNVKMVMNEMDAIIDAVNEGIYIADGNGLTLRINKAYERIAGVNRNEVLGHTMQHLVDRGFIDQSVTLRVLQNKCPESLLQRLRSGITALVSGTPLFDEHGDIYRVVTSVRDVDELNSLREQLEKTDTLNEEYQLELHRLRAHQHPSIVSKAACMRSLIDLALRVARVDSNVLIQGESGVGKEMLAELIHSSSTRASKPFIKVNCTAIPESLFESEFFGYIRGAFTGASRQGKAGIFEAADGGTILLDEIGDMPLPMQVKLLRVIQERQIRRIGDTTTRDVDVRLLCASNRDLQDMVTKGLFREDLYYRLSVVPLLVPPLRNRYEDIPFLTRHFMRKYCLRYGLERTLHPEALELFMQYGWPGNVRELENLIERLVVTVAGPDIQPHDLPPAAFEAGQTRSAPFRPVQPAAQLPLRSLRAMLDEAEASILRAAYAQHGSSRRVAAVLQVDQSTVLRKASRLGIKPRTDSL